MNSIDHILLAAAVLLLLSVLASKASAKLGVPALLLFLLVGMLAGSDGPGGIYFDNAAWAQSLGVVALALILFSGGLDTQWSSVRRVMWPGLALSTIGVLVTTALVGIFVKIVLGFSLLEGLLLGSIVSSTDAAAVFSVLKASGVGLKGRTRPLLEMESGSNDPMAVFLTTGIIGIITVGASGPLSLIPMFIQQMAIGSVARYAMGKLALLVSLFLILVARPVSVFLSLALSRFKLNEKTLLSWVGLRGAVPIVLATFPLLAQLPRAEMLFDLVFFIVLTSILLQGTSMPLFARWLKLDAPPESKPPYPLELEPEAGLQSDLVNIGVPRNSPVAGRQIVEVGFPRGALIVLVGRGDSFIVAKGATVIQPDDRLLVLADKEDLAETRRILAA